MSHNDAQDYYAKVKAEKGYTSEVWKVAVNQERRKEFSAEPYLRSDLQKSGFLEEHVNTAYPKNSLPENGPFEAFKIWWFGKICLSLQNIKLINNYQKKVM